MKNKTVFYYSLALIAYWSITGLVTPTQYVTGTHLGDKGQ